MDEFDAVIGGPFHITPRQHPYTDTVSPEKSRIRIGKHGPAWLWTRYAGFRLVTVYLAEGVFDGVEFVGEIRCVHPVQAYVDLKDHPERAAEAAGALRRRLFLRGDDDL